MKTKNNIRTSWAGLNFANPQEKMGTYTRNSKNILVLSNGSKISPAFGFQRLHNERIGIDGINNEISIMAIDPSQLNVGIDSGIGIALILNDGKKTIEEFFIDRSEMTIGYDTIPSRRLNILGHKRLYFPFLDGDYLKFYAPEINKIDFGLAMDNGIISYFVGSGFSNPTPCIMASDGELWIILEKASEDKFYIFKVKKDFSGHWSTAIARGGSGSTITKLLCDKNGNALFVLSNVTDSKDYLYYARRTQADVTNLYTSEANETLEIEYDTLNWLGILTKTSSTLKFRKYAMDWGSSPPSLIATSDLLDLTSYVDETNTASLMITQQNGFQVFGKIYDEYTESGLCGGFLYLGWLCDKVYRNYHWLFTDLSQTFSEMKIFFADHTGNLWIQQSNKTIAVFSALYDAIYRVYTLPTTLGSNECIEGIYPGSEGIWVLWKCENDSKYDYYLGLLSRWNSSKDFDRVVIVLEKDAADVQGKFTGQTSWADINGWKHCFFYAP